VGLPVPIIDLDDLPRESNLLGEGTLFHAGVTE
jgi:hypothetical protein